MNLNKNIATIIFIYYFNMPKPKCFTIRSGKVICDKSSGATKNYDDKKVNPNCSKRKGKWSKGCYGKDKPKRAIMNRVKAPTRRPPTRKKPLKSRLTTTELRDMLVKNGYDRSALAKMRKADLEKLPKKPKAPKAPKVVAPKVVVAPKKPKKVKLKRIPRPPISLDTWYREDIGANRFVKYVDQQKVILANGPKPYKIFRVGNVRASDRNREKKDQYYTQNEKRVDIQGSISPFTFFRNKLVPVTEKERRGLEKAEKKKK